MIDGHRHEPYETLIVTINESVAGSIIQTISDRKGLMQSMSSDA